MRSYLAATAVLFGLVTLAHIWRALAESRALATDPWFVLLTIVCAALCIWGARLWATSRRVTNES